MKKFYVFLVVLIGLNSCAYNQENLEKENERLRQENAALLEQNKALSQELNTTKTNKQDLMTAFKDAQTKDENLAISLANQLITDFNGTKEANAAKEYKQNLQKTYNQNLDKIKQNLSYKKSGDYTWYYDKKTQNKINIFPIILYIQEKNNEHNLMLRVQTFEDKKDNIFTFGAKTNNGEYQINYTQNELSQDKVEGGYWIRLDKLANTKQIQMAQEIINAKNANIRFFRRSGFFSVLVGAQNKDALKNVLDAYALITKLKNVN